MKKVILVIISFVFFFGFDIARAGVVIDEVKILPVEDRFIKLYNQGNSEIDLTNWYIQRKTQAGSSFSSLVSKTYFENKKISANGYFLISRVLMENSDIVIDNLILSESNVIQLKDLNGEVVDKVCWGNVADCGDLKIPNPDSGQSIKITQDTFVDVPVTQVFTEPVSSSAIEPKTKITEIPKIKTQIIISKSFGFVGFPLILQATTFGYNSEQLRYGKYFWNFGDGDSKEIKLSDNQTISHIYFYPGDYVISLDYFQNYYSDKPDSSSQIVIKIIEADISISRVGDEKDFFVELLNNTDYNVDLSNWFLISNKKSFTIPRNTILAPKKKMIISPKITNFSIADKNTLKLMTPGREIVFDYNLITQPPKSPLSGGHPIEISSSLDKSVVVQDPIIAPEKRKPREVSVAVQPLVNNLLASSVSSDIVNSNSNSSLPIVPMVSFVFIGASAGAVYFIRKKKVISKDGDDFEILDK